MKNGAIRMTRLGTQQITKSGMKKLYKIFQRPGLYRTVIIISFEHMIHNLGFVYILLISVLEN